MGSWPRFNNNLKFELGGYFGVQRLANERGHTDEFAKCLEGTYKIFQTFGLKTV